MVIKFEYCALLAILLLSLNLSAQQRDTIYVTDTQVIRDTLIVRDTIYQHDTVKIRHQADVKSATTEDNSVKITLPAKADTSVEAVEMPVLDDGSSQKEQKKKWYADLPEALFFKGFQLG